MLGIIKLMNKDYYVNIPKYSKSENILNYMSSFINF